MIIPLLVGGAALSAKFTEQKIAPSYGKAVCYAKDAMTGLRLMNELMDPGHARDGHARAYFVGQRFRRVHDGARRGDTRGGALAESTRRPADSSVPNLDRKVRLVPDLREIWSYINPFMLFGRHLGFKGDFEKRLGAARPQGRGAIREHGRSEERSGNAS